MKKGINIFIFEFSGSPHESSLISMADIFVGLKINTYLCLSNSAFNRVEEYKSHGEFLTILNLKKVIKV